MASATGKRFPFVPLAVALAATGSLAALLTQFYRRPLETMNTLTHVGLLLAGVREETIVTHGLPIRYYCAGRRGSPMILIHGLGGSAENWATLILLLSEAYLVYAPDLPGFRKTPLAPEGVTISTHTLYMERFLDALGYPRVTLVGNSFGGWIATRFAVAHPERVDHLYLLNSAGLQREGAHSPYTPDRKAAHRAAKEVWGYPFPVPRFVLDAMIRNSQQPAYAGFIKGYDPAEELDDVLSQIRVPTTIIWGEDDRLLPITCAHDFHAGIPNSELLLLPGVGHTPQIQATATVARIIFKASRDR